MATEIDGDWRLDVKSPMGTQHLSLVLREQDGALTGTMTNTENHMTTEIFEGSAEGDRLTWKATLKLLRMTLAFSTTVDGDSMSGTVKAGVFGKFGVSGERE